MWLVVMYFYSLKERKKIKLRKIKRKKWIKTEFIIYNSDMIDIF